MKINKPAGFWWRILSRIIDLAIVLIIISLTIYFLIDKKNNTFYFKQEWYFYLWTSTSMITIFVFTIGIPLMTKGRSIGNYITKTKIKSEGNIYKSIFYRELFFGFTWITIIFLFMVILTPNILLGVISTNSKITLSGWDQFRFSFINVIAGVTIFIQMIFGISILIKKQRKSFIDSLSNSVVVKTNKFVEVKKEKKTKEPQPRMAKDKPIIWVKGE